VGTVRLRRGLSPVVASAILAVAVAAGLAYVVYWAREQASSLPQQLLQPCPVVVQAVRNGSSYLLFAVFNGDMRGEVVYVVVGRVSAEAPTIYWEYFGSWTGERPAWADTKYGFDGFFSSTPAQASGTTDRVYFTSVASMPGPVSSLPRDPHRYFAMRYTVVLSPRSSGAYTFTLRCVGACDLLAADALTGAGTLVVSNYGRAWGSDVRTNTSTYPLHTGRVYALVVRHVSWTQSSYLELSINGQPVTLAYLSNSFYGYVAEVVGIPGQGRGSAYVTLVEGVPLVWACRGFVAPVMR